MRTLKYIILVVVLLLSTILFLIFYPDSYTVPAMKNREGTKYWQLGTGSKIAYTLVPAIGKKKPFPIVFLQGGPGGFISDSNIKILGLLANDGYDIYLYDQTGSGHSSRLKDIREYTADRHKRDLEAIVSKIKAKKVILIGQSWGAILATLYIADNPTKTHKLILTGPGPIAPFNNEMLDKTAPDSLHLKQPVFTNKMANDKANSLRTRSAALAATRFGKKLMSDKEADNFQTYLNFELNKATVADPANAKSAEGGGGYYAQLMTFNSLLTCKDPRTKLKGLQIPLLLMRGEFDNQKWGAANEYLDLFPYNKLIIVKEAGHSIATERPDIYIKSIRDFLNR